VTSKILIFALPAMKATAIHLSLSSFKRAVNILIAHTGLKKGSEGK